MSGRQPRPSRAKTPDASWRTRSQLCQGRQASTTAIMLSTCKVKDKHRGCMSYLASHHDGRSTPVEHFRHASHRAPVPHGDGRPPIVHGTLVPSGDFHRGTGWLPGWNANCPAVPPARSSWHQRMSLTHAKNTVHVESRLHARSPFCDGNTDLGKVVVRLGQRLSTLPTVHAPVNDKRSVAFKPGPERR
jgi:hypothetical protein